MLDASQNKFVFANTGGSTNHVVGWRCIHNACLDSGVANPELLTATANRHRVSTHFAGLDLSEQHRQLFYAHMGHEGNVNQGTYQHPLAVQEVIVIGSRLHEMDGESPDQHLCPIVDILVSLQQGSLPHKGRQLKQRPLPYKGRQLKQRPLPYKGRQLKQRPLPYKGRQLKQSPLTHKGRQLKPATVRHFIPLNVSLILCVIIQVHRHHQLIMSKWKVSLWS